MTFTHRFNTWQRNPDGKERCIVLRWGAIGDMLVAGSVLPGLKRGYHLTMHTNATGAEVLANNPNIDEFTVTDNEVAQHPEFMDYLGRLDERYDKVVNLDHSLECLLLARKENSTFHYPHEARRYLFDKNYLEMAHLIAGVPPEFAGSFFPTEEEIGWAAQGRQSSEGRPIVLWAIAGSSLNKIYPWVNVVAGWLAKEKINVIFTGGKGPSQGLEHAIITTLHQDDADMSYIYPRTGIWSLRHALTFAQAGASVVVGPETGLLHGPAFHPVPKVVYLSHSSPENLTKHWCNTVVLTPDTERCPCYPCHMVHESWDDCVVNEETSVAQCASSIPPEVVYEAVMDNLN